MKYRIIASLAFLLIITASNAQEQKLDNRKDSLSYAVGVSMYNGTLQFELSLDYDMVAVGFLAAADSMAKMNTEQANDFISRVHRQVQEANVRQNKELGKKFLEENKKQKDIVTTQTGLQYRIIKQGTGQKPTIDQKVKVHYTGYLLDGTKFDSSHDRGTEAVFGLKSIIPGWQQALTLMPVGSEWVIYVPSELAYGDRAMGSGIPAGSTLIFEIQLLDIWSDNPTQNP
ncbi:FKBP-type peptidyl-prolyl cis-trans isomerase [Bacteroidota bacterium]